MSTTFPGWLLPSRSAALAAAPLLFLALGPWAPATARDGEAPPAVVPQEAAFQAPARGARHPMEALRRYVPWAYPDWIPVAYGPPDVLPAAETAPAPEGIAESGDDWARLAARAGRAPMAEGPLRLTPNEALGVRVAAGLEPPTVQRGALSASGAGPVGFAPSPYSLPSFPELPGGIVFGLPLDTPEDLAPKSVAWEAGGLAIETQGETLRFAPDSARDLLACLRQARATRGSDALVSITRSGRVQLSDPFLRAPAGRALALADLAPYRHLPNAPGTKSLILDRKARLERAPDGSLVPLVDLEVRFYADRSGDEPQPGDLRLTLFFEALADTSARAGLYFRAIEPSWGREPLPGALNALARDLEPASRLAAWTAVFRWLDEAGAEGLENVERDLAIDADREAHDANRHVVPRLR